MITTNDSKPTGNIEPKKLRTITTAIIPNAQPRPEPKGTDPSKMITTHDMGAKNRGAKEAAHADAEDVKAPSPSQNEGGGKKGKRP